MSPRGASAEECKRAGRGVFQRMTACGLTAASVARKARVDERTVQRLVRGEARWPHESTRNRIEDALGLKHGTIARYAVGSMMLRDFTNAELAEELLRRALERERRCGSREMANASG